MLLAPGAGESGACAVGATGGVDGDASEISGLTGLESGACSLGVKDVRPLGEDIVHSVTNPTSKFTGAIHIYGGDLFTAHRSEWEPETLSEQRFDGERARQVFEEANRRHAAGLG